MVRETEDRLRRKENLEGASERHLFVSSTMYLESRDYLRAAAIFPDFTHYQVCELFRMTLYKST